MTKASNPKSSSGGADRQTLLQQATALLTQQRYVECLLAVDETLRHQPESLAAWMLRGGALVGLGRHQEALAALNAGLRFEQTNKLWVLALGQKGKTLVNLKRFAEGLHVLEESLKQAPDRSDFWYAKGNALFGLRRYEDACRAYEQALHLEMKRLRSSVIADILVAESETFIQLKRPTDALRVSEQAIQTLPENAMVWYMRGKTLVLAHQADEAIQAFHQARILNPGYYEAWRAEIRLLVFRGRIRQAWRTFVLAGRSLATHRTKASYR
ncbi:MAG TPA: tetratricopeptide repeat protein [Ktedonobacterales bacterium]|nr:tetratricopeptide repeat protein [Ktedonobacterales bacterium]